MKPTSEPKEDEKQQHLLRLLNNNIRAYGLFRAAGLCESMGVAKRLIHQGGLYINRERIADPYQLITIKDAVNGEILLQRGKKTFYTVRLIVRLANARSKPNE